MEQGTRITNRYEIINKLGQGGMGVIYKVYDRLEKQEVALKQVATPISELTFSSKGAKGDETTALIQEFSLLASLRHPNIISVLDYGLAHGRPFFTMEFIPQSQNFIDAVQGLSEVEQIKLLIQILEALRYLHRRGVIHRDLKPDNVLVLAENQVKVLDFGLSVNAEVARGRAGTLSYMSPETLTRRTGVPQSDLYAVGVMAYQMITGALPFVPDDIMGIVARPADTDKLGNHPATMVIERLLMKNPEDRYASANDCIRAFQQASGMATDDESVIVRESFLQASTFVGRDTELQTLKNELALVMQGSNSFYLIGGESGVGKSRLLDELRIQALVSSAIVLYGQAVEGGGLPFQLWGSIVRHLLLIADITDVQASVLKGLVPEVSDLVGRDIPDAPELTGRAFQDRLILTIIDLVRQVQAPLVLLLEDLQWSGESLVLLQKMLQVSEQLPALMVVANYRSDEAPHLNNKLNTMTHIYLDRLDASAIQQLSVSMLGDIGAREPVIDLLREQSEGNLFFLVETVRALAEESGHLDRIGINTLPEQIVTGGMQQLAVRRLDKVDGRYLPVQRMAAVLGREIDKRLLMHLFAPQDVEAWLISASEHAVADVRENTWRFAHDIFRETIILNIDPAQKQELHRTAAESIESVYPDNDVYNETLFRHWRNADNLDKELHYLRPVVEHLLEVSGLYDDAQALMESALNRMATSNKNRAFFTYKLARRYELQGHYADALRFAEEARTIAGQTEDDSLMAILLNCSGRIAGYQDRYDEAITLHQQSRELYQQLDDTMGVASCLHNLGVIARTQANYDHAIDLFEQSRAIFRESGTQDDIANSLNNLGIVAAMQSDFDRATALFQESLDIYQELGNRRVTAQNLNNLGVVAQMNDDFDRATDLIQQSLVVFRQMGIQPEIARTLDNLGWIKYIQGDDTALAYFVESLQIACTIGLQVRKLFDVAGLAGVFQLQGQWIRAAELSGMLDAQPLVGSDLRERIQLILSSMQDNLSPETLQTAFERGKQLDFETVVQELLDEAGSQD